MVEGADADRDVDPGPGAQRRVVGRDRRVAHLLRVERAGRRPLRAAAVQGTIQGPGDRPWTELVPVGIGTNSCERDGLVGGDRKGVVLDREALPLGALGLEGERCELARGDLDRHAGIDRWNQVVVVGDEPARRVGGHGSELAGRRFRTAGRIQTTFRAPIDARDPGGLPLLVEDAVAVGVEPDGLDGQGLIGGLGDLAVEQPAGGRILELEVIDPSWIDVQLACGVPELEVGGRLRGRGLDGSVAGPGQVQGGRGASPG